MNRILKSRCLAAALLMLVGCLLSAVAATAPSEPASYPSADAAATALVQAVRADDQTALVKILGGDWKDYIPVQGIQRANVDLFLKRYDEKHSIDTDGDTAHLNVGAENWVLPMPIVKASGSWHFDLRGAEDEIRTRRIGANELAVQEAMLAYYDAQRDYASVDRDGDKVLQYAQRFTSSPGKHDGLYWPVSGDEQPSPLGALFAEQQPKLDYHGYHFRILTAQGPSAPGGAYNYIVGGRMTTGFALIAWPAQYGETGVMSFMVSHDGEVFQQDMGKNTAAIAQSMKAFDPDSNWTEVKPDQQ